jgi:diguanylate cyclase (GGDEF)-like protein
VARGKGKTSLRQISVSAGKASKPSLKSRARQGIINLNIIKTTLYQIEIFSYSAKDTENRGERGAPLLAGMAFPQGRLGLQKRAIILNENTALLLRAGLIISLLGTIATMPLPYFHPRALQTLLWVSVGYGLLTSLLFPQALKRIPTADLRKVLIGLDVLLISALVWAAGPQYSILSRMYYIPIICAAVWLGGRATFITCGISFIIYLALNYNQHGDLLQHWPGLLSALFGNLALALVLSFISSELSARKRAEETLHHAFEHLTASYNVAHAGNLIDSVEDTIDQALGELGRLSKAQTCFIALTDNRGEWRIFPGAGAREEDFCRPSAEAVLLAKAPVGMKMESESGKPMPEAFNALTFPLGTSKAVLGVVQLQRKQVFRTKEKEALGTFCGEIAWAIETIRLRMELRLLATTDAVTGLYNRAQLSRQLEQEIVKAQLYGRSLSMLMLDIDGFKLVNDSLGHTAGDRVLRLLTEVLRQGLRDSDTPCRWGGDEFCVLLPETTLEGALVVAARLRRRFQMILAGQMTETSQLPITVTLSIGIITNGDGLLSAEQLLTFADRALYAAKRGGKNQVKAFAVGNDTAPPTPESMDNAAEETPAARV